MTSPDNRPQSAYSETQPKTVGSWTLLGQLGKLGEKIIMTPLAHLLSWILGGSVQDWDTLGELANNIIPALIRLPIRILAQLLGLIPIVGDTIESTLTNYLAATANTASTAQSTASAASSAASSAQSAAASAKATAEDTVKNMYNTWFGGSAAAGNPNEATYVIQAVKDAIINGYTVETKTTSGTWTKPSSISELIVICVGGGADGADGDWAMAGSPTEISRYGGAGGINGGYVTQSFDPATIDSSVPYTVGSPGLPSSFGSYLASVPGSGGISSQFGFTPTVSIPGSGGKGGDTINGSPQGGATGGSSAIGPGGAGGSGTTGTGNSPAGTNGTTVALTVPTKCGGGGGGGGGAKYFITTFGSGYAGAGGNAGYPGGGGGGGGALVRGNSTSNGTGGAKGVGAAGVIWIFHR